MRVRMWLLAAAWLGAIGAAPVRGQQQPDTRVSSQQRSDGGAKGRRAPSAVEQARALFEMGVELSRQERWSDAERKFRQSFDEVPRANTAFNWALALLHLERGKEALDALAELQRLSDPGATAERSAVSRMRERALALVARLRLTVEPSHAVVEVDGRELPGEGRIREAILEPGVHELHVHASGHRMQHLRLDVAAGRRMEREVVLQAARRSSRSVVVGDEHTPTTMAASSRPVSDLRRSARPDRQSDEPRGERPHRDVEPSGASGVPSWVSPTALGAGAVLLVAGSVTGVLALRADAAFKDGCPDVDRCDATLRSELEPIRQRARRLSVATDVLLLGGALAAGTGLVLWLLEGAGHESQATAARRLEPTLTAGGIGVRW